MQLQLVIITNQNKLVTYYISGSDVSSHMLLYNIPVRQICYFSSLLNGPHEAQKG